jgi:hypothetical protein
VAEIKDLISTLGFPIFVAMVLLWRVDRMHTDNIRVITALTAAIVSLDRCIIDRIPKEIQK